MREQGQSAPTGGRRIGDRPQVRLSPKGFKIVRVSALLIAIGLLVQMLTLGRATPSGFLTFAMVGAAMVGVGVIGFFWSRFV